MTQTSTDTLAGVRHQRRLVGFDLETTSANPHEARIVTAAITSIDPADPQAARVADWLVNPDMEIPEEAAAIHGVSTEKAIAEGVMIQEALPQIIAILEYEMSNGAVLVAMNAAYDFTVLQAEALRNGVGVLYPAPVVDPMVLDRRVDTYRAGKRTLSHLCLHYGVTLDDAHSAGADAKAAVEVALSLAKRYPQLRMDPDHIHESQVMWRREQALDLQAYLRRRNPNAIVDTEWPVLPPV